ncbi:hypothetical protein A988_11894 [Pseudomonas syringae BRIP39023]|nr:hypothetical protein A988_11894 [Pseudomonas syringae BRIP39023]
MVEQTRPLRLRGIWPIDSKFPACDLIEFGGHDVAHGEDVSSQVIVYSRKLSAQYSSNSLRKRGLF